MTLEIEHNADARLAFEPLVRQLRLLSKAQHDDLTIADDAAEAIVRMRDALSEMRDRIKDHAAYAELTPAREEAIGGDTAELSYLARLADEALCA